MRRLMTGAIAMLMTTAFAYSPFDFDKKVSISLSESAQAKVTSLGDDLQESPLKAVNPIGRLYGNSLHFLSFQLWSVKSDNNSKLGPEINA